MVWKISVGLSLEQIKRFLVLVTILIVGINPIVPIIFYYVINKIALNSKFVFTVILIFISCIVVMDLIYHYFTDYIDEIYFSLS